MADGDKPKRLLPSSTTLEERRAQNAAKRKEKQLDELVRKYAAKKEEKQLWKRLAAAAEGGGSTTPSGGAATGGASASAASAGGGRATPSGGAATGGASAGGGSAAAAPDEDLNLPIFKLLQRLLKASIAIAALSAPLEQPPSADMPTTDDVTISATPVAQPPFADVSGRSEGIKFPEEATGEYPFVTSATLSGITAVVSSLPGATTEAPSADKIAKFNKLLSAICTIAPGDYFRTPNCLTITRILADLVHDAHAHAKVYRVGEYLSGLFGTTGIDCRTDISNLFSALLTDTGNNRPAKIHEELEDNLKKMGGTYYTGVITAALANNVVEDDISTPDKYGPFIEKLRSNGITKLKLDSMSGNPTKIFRGFTLFTSVDSEADGASKLGPAKLAEAGITNSTHFRDGITLPVRNMFANYTHEISYEGDKPKIVVKNGMGVIVLTLTGDAGLPLNGLCKAADVPFARKGKTTKPVTITRPDGTTAETLRAETLLIKPLTDLAQVYFAALLYHVYDIKTVFITMDSYCLYVAALFCLPVVMYAHPGGQRIYSFSKNVFQLTPVQISKIYLNLQAFIGREWSSYKEDIDTIRNYFWKIYNNSPFIIPFILASRVLSDIDQVERECYAKFLSIQAALLSFSSADTPEAKFQHIQNHASLASFNADTLDKYIFDDMTFKKNVSKNIAELHSALTLGDYPIEGKLGSQTWAEVKVAIDRAVSELTTILSEYEIKDNHEELINIYIAQQLFENSYLTKIILTTAGEIPAAYKIYFNYWAVLRILFGVANEVRNIPSIKRKVKGNSRVTTYKYIRHTIPIRLYLHKDGIPTPVSSINPLEITYSNIVTGVYEFIKLRLPEIKVIGATNISPSTIFDTVRGLATELEGVDSLFNTTAAAMPVSAATAGSASAPVKTTHDLYQFVKCVLSIYDTATAASAASVAAKDDDVNVSGRNAALAAAATAAAAHIDTDCPEIIKKVLTYIYNNMTAAYIGNVDDPGGRFFSSRFNITVVSQYGGANSDDEEDEATGIEEKEEEEVDENFDDIEMLAETLADIHEQQEETNAAAAVYSDISGPAHVSIDESVDEAIAAAKSALAAAVDPEAIIASLMKLLYSLRHDAEESGEGTTYLAKYHTLEALLDLVINPADIRMLLRYYLVQDEWMSKYTSYLIPADVIDGFLKSFDRLTVAPATVTAAIVSAKAPPGEETGGQASAGEQSPVQLVLRGQTPETKKLEVTGSRYPPTMPQSMIPPSRLQPAVAVAAGGARRTMGRRRRTTASRKPRRQTRRLRPRQQRRTRRQQRQATPRQHKSDMPPLE